MKLTGQKDKGLDYAKELFQSFSQPRNWLRKEGTGTLLVCKILKRRLKKSIEFFLM